jgi:hypothetical protein
VALRPRSRNLRPLVETETPERVRELVRELVRGGPSASPSSPAAVVAPEVPRRVADILTALLVRGVKGA